MRQGCAEIFLGAVLIGPFEGSRCAVDAVGLWVLDGSGVLRWALGRGEASC
jgi:hypothetical protein